jgi:hypothetical protein
MALEPVIRDDGWLSLSAPICGDPLDLLRRQSRIAAPVKLVSGPALMAEMPVEDHTAPPFAAVREALDHALELLEKNVSNPAPLLDVEAVGRQLQEDDVAWTAEEGGFAARFEGVRVVAKIADAVVFQTGLARLGKSEGAALRALVHFSLALNARLRLARASFLDDRLVLEAVLPPSALTPAVIRKALGSLRMGAQVAKKECAALAGEQLADLYLKFHEEE